MPHTNRKKKTGSTAVKEEKKPLIAHTKRKEVEDTDGWTHVVDIPRSRNSKSKNDSIIASLRSGKSNLIPNYLDRTLEEAQAEYEHCRKTWEESSACAELKEIFVTGTQARRPIDNIVHLGLGTFQESNRTSRFKSTTQLAALQTITKVLGGSLKVVAQDPQFNALDKEFLASLGHTVVDDPEAFSHITKGTLVYAIHCYQDVYASACNAHKMAMLIGTDISLFDGVDTRDPELGIMKKLGNGIHGCKELDFPEFPNDHAFNDTKIYWREASAEVAVLNAKDTMPEPSAAQNAFIQTETETSTKPTNNGAQPEIAEADPKTDADISKTTEAGESEPAAS